MQDNSLHKLFATAPLPSQRGPPTRAATTLLVTTADRDDDVVHAIHPRATPTTRTNPRMFQGAVHKRCKLESDKLAASMSSTRHAVAQAVVFVLVFSRPVFVTARSESLTRSVLSVCKSCEYFACSLQMYDQCGLEWWEVPCVCSHVVCKNGNSVECC